MRGKHAAAAARRRESEARATTDDLRDELRAVKDALTKERRKVHDQETLRTEIARLRKQVSDNTSDEAEAKVDDIQRHWDKVTSDLIEHMSEVGVARLEKLGELLNAWDGAPTFVDSSHEKRFGRKHGSKAMKQVQKARRDR